MYLPTAKIRTLVAFLLALGPYGGALAGPAAGEEPIDIGSRRELFVDSHLIDRLKGASLKLHRPHLEGDAISFDKPWRDASSAMSPC